MKSFRKNFLLLVGIICVFSCLIVVLAMPYARMVLDDFGYATRSHQIWISTHSLLKTINVAIEQVKITYYRNQGSFIATFFHAFNGTTFQEKYYFIALIIHFSIFIYAIWKMTYIVFRLVVKADWIDSLILFFLILGFSVNFVPDTTDAFYAFNLCSMYTGFYDLFLIAVAFFIECIVNTSLSIDSRKKTITLIMCCLFIFLAGGGHLSVVAMIIIGTVGMILMTLLQNKNVV